MCKLVTSISKAGSVLTVVLVGAFGLAAPAYASEADQPSAQCQALSQEAGEPRSQGGGASARKIGGFLANAAGRALTYAPAIDAGDGALGRAAVQAAESEAHSQASASLDQARLS